jgi:acetyltransferase-like isoleucine patch superfamily enzyme
MCGSLWILYNESFQCFEYCLLDKEIGGLMTLKKIKTYYNHLRKANLIGLIKVNLFKKYSGWFIPYKKGYYNIHNKSEIIINNNSKFIFNYKHSLKDPFMGYFTLGAGAKLIVNGNFSVYTGGRIGITKNAILELGSGYINHNVFLACRDRITIGRGVKIASNVVIRDNDAHEIIGEEYVSVKPIEIGDHVWIGTNVTILKGVKIGSGTIIAAHSLVNKDIPAKVLAGGVPAKILRENIEWK